MPRKMWELRRKCFYINNFVAQALQSCSIPGSSCNTSLSYTINHKQMTLWCNWKSMNLSWVNSRFSISDTPQGFMLESDPNWYQRMRGQLPVKSRLARRTTNSIGDNKCRSDIDASTGQRKHKPVITFVFIEIVIARWKIYTCKTGLLTGDNRIWGERDVVMTQSRHKDSVNQLKDGRASPGICKAATPVSALSSYITQNVELR